MRKVIPKKMPSIEEFLGPRQALAKILGWPEENAPHTLYEVQRLFQDEAYMREHYYVINETKIIVSSTEGIGSKVQNLISFIGEQQNIVSHYEHGLNVTSRIQKSYVVTDSKTKEPRGILLWDSPPERHEPGFENFKERRIAPPLVKELVGGAVQAKADYIYTVGQLLPPHRPKNKFNADMEEFLMDREKMMQSYLQHCTIV